MDRGAKLIDYQWRISQKWMSWTMLNSDAFASIDRTNIVITDNPFTGY